MHLGTEYGGYTWHISSPGATCDSTCGSIGSENLAKEASSTIRVGDCAIIRKFFHLAQTALTDQYPVASSWTFGYFDTNFFVCHCSNYGFEEVGTKQGTPSSNLNRRVVCPCSTSK